MIVAIAAPPNLDVKGDERRNISEHCEEAVDRSDAQERKESPNGLSRLVCKDTWYLKTIVTIRGYIYQQPNTAQQVA
ncbi:hypothetical protein TNCV_2683611 [Trichonephila clavipes]|nr:hypothetical protein TNCV_2683611 [Trichonephila clavipes]